MRFVAILGQLCEIATSHNIRSPVVHVHTCVTNHKRGGGGVTYYVHVPVKLKFSF